MQEREGAKAQGQLVVVATPLGNLGDISRRALEILESADVVYCEDTRHSNKLFSAYAIAVRSRLESLHEHNEASQCARIVERVRSGDTVVIISDAGTPGISDPGTALVVAARAAGIAVEVPASLAGRVASYTLPRRETDG